MTMATQPAAPAKRLIPKQLAPLKISPASLQETPNESPADTSLPLSQLDSLWHYECVVSPRSPTSSPKLLPSSPRSPALSPLSPASRFSAPPSPVASTSSRTSSLSRFASSDTPNHHKVLQRVFNTFDENGDGCVSVDEISSIFERLGIPSSEYSIQSLLARLDTKSQGHVDEDEFVRLYDTVCSCVDELDADASSSSIDDEEDEDLLAVFHVFDKDGNGFISASELQSVLCSLGFPQARQLDACVDMIARMDDNGDGHIDFSEFKKLFHLEDPFMTNSIEPF